MKKKIFIVLASASFFLSCARTNLLTDLDMKWMPYSGNETLVFRSNSGELDSIFFLKKMKFAAYPDAPSPLGLTYEVLSIFCKHTDSNDPRVNRRYLENQFFQIRKAKDNRAELKILLAAKDAEFYRISPIKLDSLSKANTITLKTQHSQFDDVYIIDSEDYLDNLSLRSSFITKVYWSKSNGLIRYDKKDGVYWELTKKSVPIK